MAFQSLVAVPTSLLNGIQLKENVKVFIDGKLVSQTHNTVTTVSYNWIMCKLFNDSTACTNAPSSGITFASYCFNQNGAGRAAFATFCNAKLGAIALSTDTSNPFSTGTTCPSQLTSGGLSPVVATTAYQATSNTITLTGSFTATASTNGVDKACLYAVYTVGTSGAATYTIDPATTKNAYAVSLFSGLQNVVNGQTLTVQWQFQF
jgi:hypothetical protein